MARASKPAKKEKKAEKPAKEEKKSILKADTKSTKRKATAEPEDKPAKKKISKAILDKLAEDEAEIAYLEKKLKIKGGKKKSMGDDMLDFLLDGLKDDYLDDRAEQAEEYNRKAAAEMEEEEKPKKKKAEKAKKEEKPPKKKVSQAVLDKIAQDEAEIAYLEKKLKIKGGKKKSMGDDMLDFVLGGLKDDYLDDGADEEEEYKKYKKMMAAEKAEKKKGKMVEGDEDDSGWEDEDSEGDDDDEEDDEKDDDDDEDSEGDFGGFEDDEGITFNSGSEGTDDDEDEDEDEDEGTDAGSDSEEEEKPAPRVRENPYRAPVPVSETPSTPVASNVQKYIPPSLRKAASTESERLTRLRRSIQGLINRLSEVKLIALLGDVEELYRQNPRADVTNILCDILVTTLCDESALNDTYHILHGGFLAGLYKIMGLDVGATIVQKIVETFLEHHTRASESGVPPQGKQCTNLISFLSELYNFQVISCVMIFDFIRLFLSSLTELHTELLLKVVRSSGPQLRADDPSALKSLVLLLQPSIAAAGGHDSLSVRTKFMIETLTNLKNNKIKSNSNSAVNSEHTHRMKKLLGTLSNRTLRATEPLRASLDDIKSIETKGKWWLVGASWVGKQAEGNAGAYPSAAAAAAARERDGDGTPPPAYVSDDEEDTAVPDLQALARQHRMNTDIRRAIFITLLSSSDYSDCYTRLSKLRLKRTQEREIPRVLLHCAASEAVYNPYYTLIAKKLCSSHQLKMTFTFVLWEYFRRFGEDDGHSGNNGEEDIDDDNEWADPKQLRKIVNLARLYAKLVAEGVLGITVLKTLNWGFLQEATRNFLTVFLTGVVTELQGDSFGLKGIFGGFADNIELVRGIRYFVQKNVKKGGVAASEKEKKMVQKGAKVILEVLDEILRAEVTLD
jgi:nucleolar MIF4G domain-containing protein 1